MVETRGGRRFAAFFFVAAFLVLLLGHWLRPVGNAALGVAAPFSSVVSAVASNVGDAVSGVVEGPQLRSENLSLRREIATLLRRNVLLQQEQRENELLSRMLRFDDANNRMDLLTARVIDTDPNNLADYIIINRGRRDGLRPGMSVLDQDGYFVGKLVDLTGNAARVLLMTSPSSTVDAIDLKTHAAGAVEGQYGGSPEFQFVRSRDMIHPGDLIVTSGLLNLFPRNLVLGQVVRVRHADVLVSQTADLRPAADFQALELVQVVRNFVPAVPTRLLTNP